MVTVVLLPGLDGSATLFEPFVGALGQQHEVKAISYPSTVPLGYAELERLVRSSLPKAGPFVVLGESFSGPVAVGLAAEPPPGLLGIVLCCSFARNPRPFLSLLGWVIGLVPVKLAPVSLLAVALLGRHSNPYWRLALAKALSPVSAVALRARLRAVLEVDALPRLAKSKVPVLYLRATEDRVVPVSASKSVAQALPSLTIIPIPGPHFLLQVSPEPAAVAVHDFIRTLSPAL